MAYKYREDLVGKRFLSVSGVTKINVNKVSEWGWKAGVIRAASLKDNKNKELQVLVEYDGVDWQRREWVAVYSRRTFRVFLVERTLVWAPRNVEGKEVKWPALTFTPLAADLTLQADAQPVEFIHDQHLQFLDYANLQPYQEWDARLAGAESGADAATLTALAAKASEWRTIQDGQRILTTTPSVLGGCRAQVYRAAGATQWYTAVIVGVNEHTGELTVTDDTVLEEHSEDPSLVQMRLLGDGVIESIMRGEVVGVMPRRSRSNLQRVEREITKSPATTGGRKKGTALRSNGQIVQSEPPTQQPGSSPERETSEITKKGAADSVSASDVVDVSEENDKCVKQEEASEPQCGNSEVEVKSEVSGGAGADGVASAVASEEDDCVIVCARDADERSDSGVSGVRSGGSASSVEDREWRGMAHGYGGGPPPPLLHLPPPPPSIYASELLWKQRYHPPLHPPLHHAIADDYLAAATFDRERHERLLRERREQEQQREMLEKQQKEKERERMEREREKQEREEKERREQENAASKLVSRHFEESLRLANQKRERSMSWSLLNSLAPSRGAAGEHERLRAPPPERGYYSPPAHPSSHPSSHPSAPRAQAPSAGDYCSPHARLSIPKPDKASHPSLPKGEPNFSPYNYPPYRPAYDKLKDPHLPAPPPLVPEKNSVIVKHDAKQIHLEQKHPYPSKPRSEPSPHYLQSMTHRPHRTALSPHAPPHPHPAMQTSSHATVPSQDKNNRRIYQPPAQPQRSPAYYQSTQMKPKVSSPAPPHIYGKPSNSSSPVHYGVAVEPPMQMKAEPPPVPYPPPSAYSPASRTRPPPVAHCRTPEPRPMPRVHCDSNSTSPCQTQPLDLGVARDDPDRLSPRRRCPFETADSDPKRRRMEELPAPEPLIAAAASVGRTPHGSEPAPQAPGPPCDVRVPSADGSVETPEKAAGASPAPTVTPSASPAPSTPVPPPQVASPPVVAAPLPVSTPPAPPVTPPVTPFADSDTPAKTASPNPRDGSAPVRHLGKKAWLQRHETAPIGEGDCSGGGGTCITLPMTINKVSEPDDSSSNIVVPVAAKSIQRGARKTTKPRKPKEMNGRVDDAEEDTSSSDREATSQPKRKPPKAKRKKANVRKVGDEPKKKKASESGSESDKESDDKDSDSGGSGSGSGSTSSKRGGGGRARGRRSRGGGNGRGGRKREDPPRRTPSTVRSKPTTESFLQNGPCFEVAPRLAKCRECRWSPAQRDKDMPNIFCRFYAFRRLKYAKNRQLAIAGFSDPYKDAEEDDKKLWLSSSAGAAELDIEMSCFLLREIGDQFCELLQQEKEAESHHLNDDKTIAWKRVVQGVREMCDVCETTLFNFHWTCGKCGFVVCLDCYKSRTSGESANATSETNNTSNASSNGERDSFGWLTCTMGGAHPARRLLLTQIAAGGALAAAAARAHTARAAWALPACACGHSASVTPQLRTAAKRLLQHALLKNIKKEEVKEENASTNGTSPVKSENGKTSSTVVSWLSDIPIKPETKEEKSDSSSSDSEGSGNNFSTLRELLIRPAPEGGEAQPKKKQKKIKSEDDLDDVISSVVDKPKDEDGEVKPFALSNVVKRYDRGRGREELPIRIMTLTESKMLYPDVPHAWLCDGKLLHLTDPAHPGNYKPFQDQWKRGQPVLVSDMSSVLDKDLWSPESFSRDFGDTRVDLVNCASGLVVPNQPARKFWDGFELAAKRLRDERGAPMVLKLKDWPPGEDFAELLPARFDDLMRVLPLTEYTSRNGKLNLAARLPECFVRPDLGPKMYTAYGGAGGTTNLHLDVSDAVNVMVHASAPADAPERAREASRAAEEAGVDVLSRRRARVKPPAALWHIYAAKDADKIRDFLVRAELERGARPRPQHDPVHDQTWYLDAALRERLYREYGVEGYAILQCPGDAVFVPAGAPHQVRNLLDCIKVAEDFVSPENVSRCFELAQQFRRLSRQHSNKEDKLQIKNIVYHAVKDSLCCLEEALAEAK